MKIHGCRVLVRPPQQPFFPELVFCGDVAWKEVGECKILIPQDTEHMKNRKCCEWEIVLLGTHGKRNPKSILSREKRVPVPAELAIGQHVLIDHTMGFKEYEHNGDRCRIYSCEDILAILETI